MAASVHLPSRRHPAVIGFSPNRFQHDRSSFGLNTMHIRGVLDLKMQRFLLFSNRFAVCSVLFGSVFFYTAISRAQLATDSSQTDSPSLMSQQIADLQKVVNRWDDAVGQHDQYALELVLAPQFISVSDTGDVKDRDQVVSEMVMKDAPHYTLAQKVVSVREVGDVAIVNGTYDREYQGSRLSRTKAREQKGVFSQVYVRARNSWECINSQHTLIAESAVKSDKKKSKDESNEKQLNHDLGFHFPGRHHSSSTDSQPQ
jgi:ketosteroid isomerase-like protein